MTEIEENVKKMVDPQEGATMNDEDEVCDECDELLDDCICDENEEEDEDEDEDSDS